MKLISLFLRADSAVDTTDLPVRCGMIMLTCFLLMWMPLAAQVFEETAPGKYRIVFTDKNHSPFSTESPGDFLSEKSLDRRNIQGIPITYEDLPVSPAYIDSIIATGARILTQSKWFNSLTIQVSDELTLAKIAKLTFVKKDYQPKSSVYKASGKMSPKSGMQQNQTSQDLDYGPSWWQAGMHNGHFLHNRGHTGKDITIAVIDAGFFNADVLPVFEYLRDNGQVLGTRDFVTPGGDVFRGHSHGMAVLSIIGGHRPGELMGTAPDADFWLLRSEDGNSEYIIEEDNWIAAAEFADSVGADIITSSLGYSEFDDPKQNHSYADMDGNTARISRAADKAVSKGMLVIASAGNEGSDPWKYVSAPADADSVLAVGAVDQMRFVAGFSSRGPSSDGQVKPDIMAIGKGTYVANLDGTIRQGNGTSFSAPVIAGLSACLWQADRSATAMELYAAIRESSDRFARPDDDYGYGIPDFNLAEVLLRSDSDSESFSDKVTAFPNPFNNQLYIVFKNDVDVPVDVTLYDLAGKEIFRRTYPQVAGRKYLKIEGEFHNLPKGAYLIKIEADGITGNSKLIKF